MTEPPKKKRPPSAGVGKKPGTVNKTTKVLKEAILMAAELTGRDKKGKEGLVGYLRMVAERDVKSFSVLLGKVLPMQITGEGGGPIPIAVIDPTTLSKEQLRAIASIRVNGE